MERIRILLSRCAALLRRRSLDEELDAELSSHLEFAIEENMKRGMSAQEARTRALREFGGVTQTKEAYRMQQGLPFLEALLLDVRYGLRQLRKSPAFAVTAVLTLALGIGGMTAVFSVVEAVLLRPLPFKDSGQLLSLHEWIREDPHPFNVTAPDVLIFQRESKAFSGEGGYVGADYDVTGAGAPFHAVAERVTASLFPVLGIDPLLGRTFTQKEDENAAPVTVISYLLWRERFESDPDVLGKTIDLDRRPYTIIGVMPRDFEFPLDAGRLSRRDLWVPMSFTPVEKSSEGTNYDYGLVARLKPGVSTAQAQIDVDRVIAGIQPGYTAISTGLHLARVLQNAERGNGTQCAAVAEHPAWSSQSDHADRLREYRKSAAGTRGITTTRIRSPSGVRCYTTDCAQAITDRKSLAERDWWCNRRCPCGGVGACSCCSLTRVAATPG